MKNTNLVYFVQWNLCNSLYVTEIKFLVENAEPIP